MLISLFKTSGHSMSPKIKEGSFFIASSIPLKFSKLKVGDIILFKYKGKNIVKKIEKFKTNNIYVSGINKSDSKKFRPIKKNEIIAKVIWVL